MMKSPSSCILQYANLLEGYRADKRLMNSSFNRLLKLVLSAVESTKKGIEFLQKHAQ